MLKPVCTDGKLNIVRENGEILVEHIRCGIRYRGAYDNTLEEFADGDWVLTQVYPGWQAVCGETVITFTPEEKGLAVQTRYFHAEPFVPAVSDFVVCAGTLSQRVRRVLGSTVGNANGNRVNEMQTSVETLCLVDGQSFHAADFCALETAGGLKLVAGYLTYLQHFGSVEICADGSLEIVSFLENHPLRCGESVESDVFYITECQDIVTYLPEYIRLSANYMNVPQSMKSLSVPTGYCTWYYYLGGINSANITKAQQDLAEHRETLPVKYFQIDDGWESNWGDWEPNEKFPEGMKACADEAKKAGWIPGIWIAPFGADPSSKVFREHPEYFIRDWGEEAPRCGAFGFYDLDYSVEGARQYLADLIKKLTYDWGFRYLKLDIITATIGPYRHADPDFNACKNYREGMQIIRRSAHPDTFILGCTAPFGGSVGLVDSMRVSCDIFERWDSVCNVFNAVLKRYYYHKNYFINDADCLIIRKAENEDSECMRKLTRSDEEILTFISATAASGGTLMLSDKLSLLSQQQIAMLSKLFPLNETAALPLDLMESRIPGILDVGTAGKIRRVVLINWENVPKAMQVKVDTVHAFEFWTGTYEGIVSGEYTAVIEPHCCKVLFFTPADGPVVVGTDCTVLPHIPQSYACGLLTTEFLKPGESQFVAANTVSGEGCSIEKNPGPAL